MLISMLKYVKTHKLLRHVSILRDHHEGVGLYLVKVTELFIHYSIATTTPGLIFRILNSVYF